VESSHEPILKKNATLVADAADAADTADTSNPVPATLKLKGEPARTIKPRKRAADFLSDDENTEPKVQASQSEAEAETANFSRRKSKKTASDELPIAPKEYASRVDKSKTNGVETKAENVDAIPEGLGKPPDSEGEQDSDESEDDQTTALITGFESSGDEDASDDQGFDPESPVLTIPNPKKIRRKISRKQKRSADTVEVPGTVYVGRIPHGFYEHQMRAYFSQFGDITRLRLSRNRVTGRSKHFAFVEFASVSVAKIVAETMDNYLLYGHILKCKFVSEDQLHPGIWKGANRRFKKVPWNKIEKKRLEQGKTREQWDQSIKKEQQRRIGQALKAEALGYHLDLPELKMTSEIPPQVKETEAIDASSEEPAIEPAKVLEAFAKDQDEKRHNGFDKQAAQPSKGEKRDRTAFSAATSGNDKPKEGIIAMVPEGELAREATTSTSSKQNNKAKKAKKKKKAKNAQK